MKKFVLLAAGFAFSILPTVKAQENPPTVESKTGFVQIQEMYQAGAFVDFSEVKTMTSGRCFRSQTPTKPEPALLIAMTETVTSDGGLTIPPKLSDRFWTYTSYVSYSPDFFDEMSSSEIAELEKLMKKDFSEYSEAKREDKNLLSIYREGNGALRARKFENDIVALMTIIKDENQYKAGEVYFACYYFKKIK